MDETVKGIIDQILLKNGNPFGQNAQVQQSAAELSRPNYQREKAQKRLMEFDLTSPATRPEPRTADGPMWQKAEAEPDSALRLVGLFPSGSPASSGERTPTLSDAPKSDTAFAVLEQAERKTLRMLGVQSPHSDAIGVACASESTLSQIFAVDRVALECPSLLIDLKWNESDGGPFSFQCEGRKEEVVKAIALLRESIRNETAVYSADTPSDLLRKKLKLARGFVAGLEGIPFPRLLPGINEYWKQNPESTLELVPSARWLLAFGEKQETLEALETLKRQSCNW